MVERVDKVLDIIKEMTILELRDLNQRLQDEFGITAAAPVAAVAPAAAAAAPGAPAAAPEAEEEKPAAEKKRSKAKKEKRAEKEETQES